MKDQTRAIIRTSLLAGMVAPLLIWLGACQQSPDLPTRAVTANAPVARPAGELLVTATPLPATPTSTFTPSPTPVIPTQTAEALSGPGVNITTPNAGSELLPGSEVTVGGLVQLSTGQTLSVTLETATGLILAESVPAINDFNSWQAELSVPFSVIGSAELRATIMDRDGMAITSDVQPVMLLANTEMSDRFLTLFRPIAEEDAVAGFNLFFDGVAQLPVNNVVTISVWNEMCQNQTARQSFVLRGSGYWQGFLVIPRNVTGPVCAIAHFGTPGDENWREVQVILNVLPIGDKKARGVRIGNPPPDDSIPPGNSLLLYGTAYNAPDNAVKVSIMLENGRILNEGVAPVDSYGYWEISLFIPADADGSAQITASIGELGDENYVENQTPINIEPGQ